MSRHVNVKLDDSASKALDYLVKINKRSVSDIINTALVCFSKTEQPVFFDNSLYEKLCSAHNMRLWCAENQIDMMMFKYVCRVIEEGKTIRGFGNKHHKWRDKEDGRMFKTKTSYIAHCLYRDFNAILSQQE